MSLSQWILTCMCEVGDIDAFTPGYREGGLSPRQGARLLWVLCSLGLGILLLSRFCTWQALAEQSEAQESRRLCDGQAGGDWQVSLRVRRGSQASPTWRSSGICVPRWKGERQLASWYQNSGL